MTKNLQIKLNAGNKIMPTKIIKYTGGLGNQMFQYAFAYVLEQKGFEVLADTKLYSKPCVRGGVDLSHGAFEVARVFGLDIKEATDVQVKKLGDRAENFFERLRRKFFTKKTHVIEYDSKFHAEHLTDMRDLYLDGYWQNPLYWKGYEDELKKQFTFALPLNEKSQQLSALINSKTKTCSIHVRRGDYLNHKTLFVCDRPYFENAISKMLELVPQIQTFIIFSDDIDWCRKNIDTHGKEKIFVDWNSGKDSWQDIALMTNCANAIIPNSSFSFWGAWLNKNPDAVIVCPKIWSTSGSTDIIPDNWKTVSVE